MKHILVSGSLAYDIILDFPDSLKNHIMPDKHHMLDVTFEVDKLEKNLGGTGGNIAYSLKKLGAEPLLLSCIGKDSKMYESHLDEHEIKTDYILQRFDTFTASAHIMSDKDGNQITAFYGGALKRDEDLDIDNVKEDIELAILAPNHPPTTMRHAKQCTEKHIPFCFDPRQHVTSFTPQELMLLIGQATYLIANDYELAQLEKKTGWSVDDMFDHVEVIIMTKGSEGSTIRTKKDTYEITAAPAESVEDPTGASDAYRAGFFYGLTAGHNFQTCGQIASVAASYTVEHYGTQRHNFTEEDFHERYKRHYGETISLKM